MASRPMTSLLCLVLPALAGAFVRYTDVHIGASVACSEDEKFCFRFNLLHDAAAGRCSALFAPCAEGQQKLVVDKLQLTAAEPTLKAKCGAPQCSRHLESLFWPRGDCLAPAAADAACEASSRTLNLFGEWECWCPEDGNATGGAPCPTAAARPQPAEAGRCAVPDLWAPATGPARNPVPPAAHGACSEDDFRCYATGQLSFQGACVTPLARGPCPEGQWVALQAADGALKSACAPRRCLDDSHVAVGAHCQPKDRVQRLLCHDGQELVIDAFGYGQCEKKGTVTPFALPNVRENGVCSVRVTQPDEVTPASDSQPPVSSSPASTVVPTPLQPSTAASASTSSSVAVSPEASTPSSVAKTPLADTQQQLVDPQPCATPPCGVSPAIAPTPNTLQASSPEVVAVPAVEVSTTPGQETTTGEVKQEQLLINQLGSLSSVTPPVEVSIQSQPPVSNVEIPSQELLAPVVTASEQQLTEGVPIDSAPRTAQIVENGTAGPAIIQKQSDYATVTPTLVSGFPGAFNPSEQSISALYNVELTQQQLVDQPQLVSTTTTPNSQLATDSVIQTLPSIPVIPGVGADPGRNVLLAEGSAPSQPNTPVSSQLLEQSQIHDLGSAVTPEQASTPASFVPPTNVAPAVSLQSEDAIVPLLQQQPVHSNVSPNPLQIVQSDPSVSSQQSTNSVSVIAVQQPNGNIPLFSLQLQQDNGSAGLVQSSQQQIPVGTVQLGRGDVVVDYVLLGQSSIPVNPV